MTPAAASARPRDDEAAQYYHKYIHLVPDGEIVATLERQGRETVALLRSLPADKAGYRYAEGKWSLAESICHVIDCERVFAYRALRIGRGDTTPLPTFDQDMFVANSNCDLQTLVDLADEFEEVRAATVTLLRHFNTAAWDRQGTASDNPVTTRALVWIIAGHELHHLKITHERYLAA